MNKAALKKSLGETSLALEVTGLIVMSLGTLPNTRPSLMAWLITGSVILLVGIISGILSNKLGK